MLKKTVLNHGLFAILGKIIVLPLKVLNLLLQLDVGVLQVLHPIDVISQVDVSHLLL